MTTATAQSTEQLADTAFADGSGRKYPVVTKTATCASATAAVKDGAAPAVIQRIKEAAQLHGVLLEVTQILSPPKVAAVPAEGHYGLPESKTYPLDTPKDVEDGIRYLGKYAAQIPYDDRRTFAANLITAVGRTGGDIEREPELKHALEITAGRGICLKKDAQDAIHARAVFTRGQDRQDLEALQTSIEEMPGMTQEFLVKLAGVLDEVDTAYQTGLRPPEESLFGLTDAYLTKVAEEHVQLKDGTLFQKQALAQITPSAIREWLGSDLVESLCPLGLTDANKVAEYIEIMPRTEVSTFLRCARSSGVEPLTAT